MHERPILFSAPMVRALLDGTKTQTRRVVKITHRTPGLAACLEPSVGAPRPRVAAELSPYGQPGDRLWVREAIRLVPDQEPDDGTGRVLSTYGADGALTVADAWPWKRTYLPPMHCPRGLSRIDLEISGVRVERLQDISEADARAEGARECDPVSGREVLLAGASQRGSFVLHYRDIWEQINGPGSWAANPFVWVVAFRRIRP